MSDVTVEERIGRAITVGTRWADNLEASARVARAENAVLGASVARPMEARARDIRDLLKILQGEEDAYIVALRST